jgi:aspartyl-tRNA(Asn)/glutamyl-tRNA(Gln) amidotransferase subunit B
MMKKNNYQDYFPTIGIECHVQMKTKTKLFAAVNISETDEKPNFAVSHICFGMPGALPVLNEKAIELGIRAAFALNTSPQKFSKFDRKHYFYPDLPKGYQITQFSEPIIIGGSVRIKLDGKYKIINITRAHIEEDAGKIIHPSGKDYSLVDLNRAGVPLLEIVSEPEIHSPAEARLYAQELNLIMRYSGVSNGDMYLGNMRFDINVSLSKDSTKLGTRTEIKNLNSFKSVEKAAEYEINRQIELLEKGTAITQETRGWDDDKQKTFSQRSKEDAHDYRYFPEPDVPPVILTDMMVENVKSDMPASIASIRDKLNILMIDDSAIDTILSEMKVGEFMASIVDKYEPKTSKKIANWLSSDVQGYVANRVFSWDHIELDEKSFVELANLVEENKVSSTSAKTVLRNMLENNEKPLKIAEKLQLIQVSDSDDLLPLIDRVISDNPQAVADIKAGQDKVMGFLVGQIMKESKGKANPEVSKQLIRKQLGFKD